MNMNHMVLYDNVLSIVVIITITNNLNKIKIKDSQDSQEETKKSQALTIFYYIFCTLPCFAQLE